MKRIISLILTAAILLGSMGMMSVFAETTVVPVFSEDFETGTFTVQTNDANTVKEIYKGNSLVMTFAKTNSSAFSGFPDQPVGEVNSNPGGNSLTNTSVALSTGSYTMTDTIAYINFPQKYTSGVLNVDFRMQRPSSGTKWVWTNLTQEAVSPGAYAGSYAVKSYTRTAGASSPNVEIRSYKNSEDYTSIAYNTSATRNASKGYNYIKMIVDLNSKKVSIYSRTGNAGTDDVYTDYRPVVEDVDFYVNDDTTSADGVSALLFESNGSTLALDDIVITHETTEVGQVAPVASDVAVSGKAFPGETLTGTYGTYTDLNGDQENGSVATWYAADDKDFTTNVTTLKTEAISAGTNSTYTLTENENGKYIRFGVTPKNNAAENSVGAEVFAALEDAVRIPQTKPVVTLLTPANNSRIYQGATINLTVDVACDNASITKVEYYANDNLIATATTAPYSATWASDELEDYAVYAKAYNNLGETTESETAYISILYYDESMDTTEDGAQIIFKDDFETGTYTVTNGTETAGNHYKEVYKNGKLQWTIAKNGTDAFSETFPTEFIADSTVTESENGSKYFTLGGRHADGVKVWHNLDEAIESGIVNLDIRMMHTSPSSGDYPTCISFYDAPFEGYASAPQKIFEIRMTKVSAGGRIRYSYPWKSDSSRGDATGNTASVNPSTGHWIDFKISVNLDTQKVKFYMKPYNSDEFIPFNNSLAGYDLNFYANSAKSSTSTTGTFTRGEKIGAIAFDGNSKGVMAPLTNAVLEFDDVCISRVASTVSFLKEDGITHFDDILAGNSKVYAKTIYTNSSSAPADLSLIIAAYGDDNQLLAVSTGEKHTLAIGETKEILTPLPITNDLIKNATKLRAFAWEPATLTPYMDASESVLEYDTIGEKELEIYLLMGQSNMSGRASYSSAEGADMDRTYLFNNNNRWSIASNPLNKYAILGDSSSQVAMGPSYYFAKTLNQYIPDLQLGLVVNAKGGSAISQWMKGTFYYENSVAKAKEAMKYGTLKGIIWHQGCSDSSKYSEYMDKLKQLVSDLRTDLGDPTLPFIAGQINPSNDNKAEFNKVITTISDHIPYSSYAKADDLTTIDGTHFDSASQKMLGQRYATEILRMNYGITGRVFEEGNTNLAIDATPSASSSYSTYEPANSNDDNNATYWQAYKTGSTVSEMPYYILDLGKECDINYVSLTDKQSDVTTDAKIHFQVQLSNDPSFATYKTIGNVENIPVYQKSTWTCRSSETGTYRYVRIIKTQPGNLGFAEITVMGNAE